MIKNIKFGIKISTSLSHLLPKIYSHKDLIDFIEISIPQEFILQDLMLIKNLKMPYAIHFPHAINGINFGDINNNKKNLEFIEKLNQFEDYLMHLNPICFIIHPESGDSKLAIQNLKRLKIRPIALENMPLKSIFGGYCLGYDTNTLSEFFNEIPDLEFCFDINHAIKASISMNIDYVEFIKEFLKFKDPLLFHIAGGDLTKEIDDHLLLYKGQYNMFEIRKILLELNSEVHLTFEIPRNNGNSIADDLKNFKFFKNL